MGSIAVLLPHVSMIPFVQEYVAPYREIDVFVCNLYNTVEHARELVQKGYQVIVTRCGIASRIKRSNLSVPVVELSVTVSDFVEAINLARKYGHNIAVVAYRPMVKGIETIESISNLKFKKYLTETDDDSEVESLVFKAITEGAHVIVGGGLFCQAAEKYGIPAVLIGSGKEAIMQAVEEALHVRRVIENEKIKSSMMLAILDHIQDGIITVDSSQKITTINLRAKELLNVLPYEVINTEIKDILPALESDVLDAMKNGKERSKTILELSDAAVFCSIVPIWTDQRVTGALIILQEINKIQQTEAHIRKQLYDKGHVARRNFSDIWGESSTIRHTIELAKTFALTDSSILITGETGTGKEIFAQAIHNYSKRRNGPFVAINCAALPADILESELFGYVGGAFTGARKEGKKGLFEIAHGGTIFLDEVTEMDYRNQSRLLRVLQEKAILPLGSDRITYVDVRVIAATNKNVKELVKNKAFREDLFFRLNVLKLEIPPLRERPEDVRFIADRLVKLYSERIGRTLRINNEAMKILQQYPWPGNVRELENVIQRVVVTCKSDTISPSDVWDALERWDQPFEKDTLYEEDIQAIVKALKKTRGCKGAAAKLLGIDRTTLWRRMRKYRIRFYTEGFNSECFKCFSIDRNI